MLHTRNAESMLRFPGDPNAPAREVINCHCVLIPGVLLPDEELGEDGEVISTEALKDAPENGKIAEKANGTERNGAVQYIGRIDESLISQKWQNIKSDVVLTDERIEHILEGHREDYELFGKYIPDAIQNPIYILEDSKNIATALYIGKADDTNISVVVKIALKGYDDAISSSVITMYRCGEKRLKRLLRNQKILYKKQ